MKKLVILSVIASFALAETIVNDLTINQNNEVLNNSNFSNGATVSQGQTDIKNNANVNRLDIYQLDGIDSEPNTNSIENTIVDGQNSKVHQGLTSIDNSRVEDTQLSLSNTIKDVTVTNGESTITQGNFIVGGESNVTGVAGIGGTNFPGGGGASGEKIVISQANEIKGGTKVENSSIHQGLILINGGADVSSTFILTQSNRIDTSEIKSGSLIRQGTTTITGGETSEIEQNIQNVIKNTKVDGTTINQSTIDLKDSTVSNINNDNSIDSIDEKNRIDDLTDTGQSIVNQSTITIENSIVDNIERIDRPNGNRPERQNNWIYDLRTNKSTINQSKFNVKGGSNIVNITYLLNDTVDSAAVNNLYSSKVENNSSVNQDITELDSAIISGTNTISRLNTVQGLTATDGSNIHQNHLKVANSTVNNLTATEYNLLGGFGDAISMDNANLTQGSIIITD